MLNGLAHMFVAPLIKNQDRGAGSAQGAPEQSWRSQFDDLGQARHQSSAIRLVHAVFKSSRERIGDSSSERGDQQGAPLHIKYSIFARIRRGQYTARLAGGER